jgi:hypothetical protein
MSEDNSQINMMDKSGMSNDKSMNQFRQIRLLINNKFKKLQKENNELREDMQCMMDM